MKVKILGINVDNVNMDEALEKSLFFLKGNERRVIYTPNPEMIMAAFNSEETGTVLNSADLVVPDGIGVVYASCIIKKPLKERVAGFDLICKIFSNMKGSVYLFGGAKGVAALAKNHIEHKYPNVRVVGYSDGYFESKTEKEVIEDINKLSPDLVLVCLGCPRQEKWIFNNKLNTKLCIGAGGSLDVFAGTVKRAPKIFQKFGLEWLYRLIKQPSRFKRMLVLPKFIITVFKYRHKNSLF